MAVDSDAGLVKRGLALLVLMLLLVCSVLFILFQGGGRAAGPTRRTEAVAWQVAVPGAPFPGNISWAALYEVCDELPSPTGWEIRHNTAATLARRGSDHVPWQHFREMLDLHRATVNARAQVANVPAEYKDPQETPEVAARRLVLIALRAVADWHTKRREMNRTDMPSGLSAVYDAVDRLAESPNLDLREQAKKTQATFFRS
jgi:hypothetical protein